MGVTVIYYTHHVGHPTMLAYCLDRLREQCGRLGFRLVAVGREPGRGMDRIDTREPVGPRGIMSQIRTGLYDAENVVYLAEHDCVYADEHFAADLRGTGYRYDHNVVRMSPKGYYPYPHPLLSMLVTTRDDLAQAVQLRLRSRWHRYTTIEPGTMATDAHGITRVDAAATSMDIRHADNTTRGRPSKKRTTTHPELGPVEAWRALLWDS